MDEVTQSICDLEHTLDYTFIDLPELVDASEDGEGHTDCVRQSHAVNDEALHNSLQQQVQQQQQQQWQQQVRTDQGTQQQYLAMPYWQQLQHGVQQEAPKLVLGPLGQALAAAAAAQSRHSGGQQPTTAADQALQQQQQQQYQQPSAVLSAGNWPQQPTEVYSTNQQAQQQVHMFGQHQSNARSRAQVSATQAMGGSSAAMDED